MREHQHLTPRELRPSARKSRSFRRPSAGKPASAGRPNGGFEHGVDGLALVRTKSRRVGEGAVITHEIRAIRRSPRELPGCRDILVRELYSVLGIPPPVAQDRSLLKSRVTDLHGGFGVRARPYTSEVSLMRLGQVAPVFLGIFVALACGSNVDESKVGGAAASGNDSSTGATATATINTGNGSTTGNPAADGSVVDPNYACATISADGEAAQVDLYFMVDITGSMNCPVPDGGVAVRHGERARRPAASHAGQSSARRSKRSSRIRKTAPSASGMRFFPVAGGRGGQTVPQPATSIRTRCQTSKSVRCR